MITSPAILLGMLALVALALAWLIYALNEKEASRAASTISTASEQVHEEREKARRLAHEDKSHRPSVAI